LSTYKELEYNLKKCEEALIDAQKYIEDNNNLTSLGALVAGFTHDLSTPIGLGLTGVSDFLEQTKKLQQNYNNEEMSQEDFEHYLQKSLKMAELIFSNLKYASSLMLSFKKIAVNQTSEQKQLFFLHDYFNEIISSLHNKLKHTNITIHNNINKELRLNSYTGVFSQIFINLILNSLIHAFDAKQKGNITISTFLDKGQNIILEYKDDGKGVSKENLEKIFTPFFTTKKNDGGSGLGTNIIHDLVINRLHGQISANSIENKGLSFKITLPSEKA